MSENSQKHHITDKKSFIFSFDKKLKYKNINPKKALFYEKKYGFGFGGNSIFIYNNWKNRNNITWDSKDVFDIPKNCQLNGGKSNFRLLSYEVYQIKK